jgi:Fe-S oxidoreductase
MTIWRVSNEIKDYTDRDVELMYETNLDSVSEAFCVDHYPVSEYLLAARQDIVKAGRAPTYVKSFEERDQKIQTRVNGDTTIISCEAADFAYDAGFDRVLKIADKLKVGVIQGYSGVSVYALGLEDKAKELAQGLVKTIADAKVKILLADGPETYYALTKLYGEMGVSLPEGVEVKMLSAFADQGNPNSMIAGKKVFFHDVRASYKLADTQPDEKVIMPDFFGPEELLGVGEVYDAPRKIIKNMGANMVFSVWSRAMARSFGMDDGMFLVLPKLAQKLAKRRMSEIVGLGAEYIVTDSLATVVFLETIGINNVPVVWLPELLL